MLILKAIKSTGFIVKGMEYALGGIIQGQNLCRVMDKQQLMVISGTYDLTEVFGETKENLIKRIKGSNYVTT